MPHEATPRLICPTRRVLEHKNIFILIIFDSLLFEELLFKKEKNCSLSPCKPRILAPILGASSIANANARVHIAHQLARLTDMTLATANTGPTSAPSTNQSGSAIPSPNVPLRFLLQDGDRTPSWRWQATTSKCSPLVSQASASQTGCLCPKPS